MNFRPWNISARDNLNLYVFVGVLVLVGAIFGAMLVHALTFEQQQDLADDIGVYAAKLQDPDALSPAKAFRDSFFFYGKWLFLIWLLGISVIGFPFVLVLDFLKGVLIGFTVALLAEQYAWKGVWFFLVATAPRNALVVPALVIASISSARFAYFVVRERLFRRKGRLLPPFVAHTAVAAVLFLVLAATALYEAYVSPALLERVAPSISSFENSSFSSKF